MAIALVRAIRSCPPGQLHPRRRKTPAKARRLSRHCVAATTAQGAGIAGGQLLAGFFGSSAGWRTPFLIVASPTIVLCGLILLFVQEPQRGKRARARGITVACFELSVVWQRTSLDRVLLVGVIKLAAEPHPRFPVLAQEEGLAHHLPHEAAPTPAPRAEEAAPANSGGDADGGAADHTDGITLSPHAEEQPAADERAAAPRAGPVTESLRHRNGTVAALSDGDGDEDRRQSVSRAEPAHADANGTSGAGAGAAAAGDEEYDEKVDWRKVGRLFLIPSNVLIFAQSIPGCIPWGACWAL